MNKLSLLEYRQIFIERGKADVEFWRDEVNAANGTHDDDVLRQAVDAYEKAILKLLALAGSRP